MPIKINLLAESQALEEMRRRDPVKRAIWVASFVVFLMLLWCSGLYWETMAARSNEKRYQTQWQDIEKKFQNLSDSEKTSGELEKRIDLLTRYSTNRFFWGSFLNGLQQSMPDKLAEKVQVVHLGSSFNYLYTEGVAAKKSGTNVIAGKPALSREKIAIIIDAKDFGSASELNYKEFKEALSRQSYIRTLLPADSVLLRGLNPPAVDPADQRQYVLFTLELQLPPIVRSEK